MRPNSLTQPRQPQPSGHGAARHVRYQGTTTETRPKTDRPHGPVTADPAGPTRSDITRSSLRSRCSHPLSSSQTPHGPGIPSRPPDTHHTPRKQIPGEATGRSGRQTPTATETTTPTPPPPHPPGKPGRARRPLERGLVPQDPTARRHPHHPHTKPPRRPGAVRAPRRPLGTGSNSTREKAGRVCDVSTHEQPPPPHAGGTSGHRPRRAPTTGGRGSELLRKEVIQPHLPVRLPCYDFVPIASPTFDHSLPSRG